MNFASVIFCISLSMEVVDYQYVTNNYTQSSLSVTVNNQVSKMGQAFIRGDYKVFAHYTYPEIVKMMGGENKMAVQLAKITGDMKNQGMKFNNITFGEVSKILKSGNQLQCTIAQHTEIKLPNGRAVSTSTLIGISTDGGRNWTFVDTSNKEISTIRKLLPNLNSAITIPPQQPPVRY
jgi:hypothetical protein